MDIESALRDVIERLVLREAAIVSFTTGRDVFVTGSVANGMFHFLFVSVINAHSNHNYLRDMGSIHDCPDSFA